MSPLEDARAIASSSSLRDIPELKSFTLTHILYNPRSPLYISIPLTLVSLSPIFLFISYFTLLIFTRRLTVLTLGLGSVANEGLSWALKRIWKGERPYMGYGQLGDGYGMPSSHTQAAAFLVAWGIGFALTLDRRKASRCSHGPSTDDERLEVIRKWRTRIYVFGLILWSLLVAYSRWYLLYHTPVQVLAGYLIGLLAGTTYFVLTELVPLYRPESLLGKARSTVEWLWEGVGGIGGWDLGAASGGTVSNREGGWGEGWILLGSSRTQAGSSSKAASDSRPRRRHQKTE